LKAAGLSIEDTTAGVSIVKGFFPWAFGGLTSALKSEELTLPDAPLERTALIRESLLAWKKQYGIKGVVFGLDFKDFTHNFIRLPLKSRPDISRALPFEMEKYLPLPIDEYIYGFHTVESSKEGTLNLVVAVRKERLGWLAECLKDTGLALLGVRCSFIEALNEFMKLKTQKNAVFIYPSKRRFHIAGFKDGLPVYFRVLEETGLQAEIEKLRETFPGGVFSAGTLPAGDLSVKTLAISVPNLVAVARPLRKGLRAPASKGQKMDFDFTPEEIALRRKDYYPYAVGALSALSVFLLISTDFYAYYKDHKALEGVEARTKEMRATAGGILELKRQFDAIENKISVLDEFRRRADLPVIALRGLSEALPEGAWLTEFSADETGRVEFKGVARRASEVIEPVEKSALFNGVQYSAAVTKKDEMERFSFKMGIER